MKERTGKLGGKETQSKQDTADNDKWGYAVCFGTVLTFVAGIGHVNSFGLIYNDFMIDTNSTAKSLTTAHGVFAIMLAFGGIILNIITKRYTLRMGGLVGSVLFTVGSFSTVFITNTNQLPFTFGVLQGIGFGMMVPVCYATMNYYFIKKRTTIMSICKASQGIIQMMYPHFLRIILIVYGFRGTLLIVSGISMNTIAGMVLMKEKWTIDKRESRIARNVEEGPIRECDELLNANNEEQTNAKEIVDHKNKSNNSIGSKILEILNVKVLKDLVYCNICIGQSFVNFSDLTFFILQPMLLFQYGYDQPQVAICISIAAGADVAGRITLAILSSVSSVNTRLLFFIATLLTLLARIVLLQVRQMIWVALVTAVLGALRAWLHVASPLVIASHVSHQDFPGAYALFMLATGVVNVSIGPLIGLLKDIYSDYIPAFYALAMCCVPCLLLWPMEYKYFKK